MTDGHRGRVGGGLSIGLSGLVAQADTDSPVAFHEALRGAVDAAVFAEEVGLDAVWTAEHHFSSSGFMPAPFVLLAAIAERTERVTIGTDVALPSMWQPVRFAEEACVLDQLSGGRVIVALGIGYRDYEFEGLGLRRRDRVGALQECVRVLRESASGLVKGAGLLDDAVELPTSPLPFQPGGPPIWGGGKVEAAVRRARRIGDGYFASMMSPMALRRRIGWLADEEPLADFAVAQTALAFVAVSGAEEISTPGLRRVQGYMQSWRAEAAADRSCSLGEAGVDTAAWRIGDEWHAATPRELPDEERLTHALVVGDPDECADRFIPFVDELADAPGDGPRHLSARLVYPAISPNDTRECIRLFATEVAPVLRERFDHRRSANTARRSGSPGLSAVIER